MQSDVVYSSETTQFGRNNKNFFCSPKGKRGNERRGMLIRNKNLQRIINKVVMKQEGAPSPADFCVLSLTFGHYLSISLTEHLS